MNYTQRLDLLLRAAEEARTAKAHHGTIDGDRAYGILQGLRSACTILGYYETADKITLKIQDYINFSNAQKAAA